jgi:hypothetical protein
MMKVFSDSARDKGKDEMMNGDAVLPQGVPWRVDIGKIQERQNSPDEVAQDCDSAEHDDPPCLGSPTKLINPTCLSIVGVFGVASSGEYPDMPP